MSSAVKPDPVSALTAALEGIRTASRRNNRKAKLLKAWFNDYVNQEVAASLITEKRQIGNRFNEQRFKRTENTVFVFEDRSVLTQTVLNLHDYVLPEHRRVYFFLYLGTAEPRYALTHRFLTAGVDPVYSEIRDAFGDAEVGDLPIAADAAEGSILPAGSHERSNESVDVASKGGGKFPLDQPLQLIVHGCPGSGKSYLIDKASESAHYALRTVFHPSTRYSDFVGGLRPESIYLLKDEDLEFVGSESEVPGEPFVQYVVRSGPLLKAYRLACLHPESSVVLLIEELSRAVASEVFGDMLQLLDRRDTEGEPLSGYSEYEIEPQPDIRAWLRMHEVEHEHVSPGNMRFPPNLYIWATMNRSDQNARQLDSAFLRRWSKKYLSYRIHGSYDSAEVLYGGVKITWGSLRSAINGRLRDLEGVPEDKFIGPYFISQRKLSDPSTIYEDLWGYIWNDVLKARASHFFEGVSTFAELEEFWDDGRGQPIGPVAVPAAAAG